MSTLKPAVVARCARSPVTSTPRSRSDGPASWIASRASSPPHPRVVGHPPRDRVRGGSGPVRAPSRPVDGFVPAIDVARDTSGATSFISPAASAATTTRLSDPIADVAVDAWSVTGGTTLGAKFAGVETKLFQAGLLPYLVYLYFLGKDEARTPAASNFGARFLLLFVIATIPPGSSQRRRTETFSPTSTSCTAPARACSPSATFSSPLGSRRPSRIQRRTPTEASSEASRRRVGGDDGDDRVR